MTRRRYYEDDNEERMPPRRRYYGADDRYGAPYPPPPPHYGRGDEREFYDRREHYAADAFADRYDAPRYTGGYADAPAPRREERMRADERQRYAREHLQRRAEAGGGARRSHLRCRDIMTREMTVAAPDATLEEIAAMMRDEDTGIIPVVETPPNTASANSSAPEENENDERAPRRYRSRMYGKLVGVITDRDIVIRALANGKNATTTRAEEVMTTNVFTAQANDRVIEAIRTMGDKQVRRIPIVDDTGILRGIISMADVALETEADRELADALEEISSGASFWNKVY